MPPVFLSPFFHSFCWILKHVLCSAVKVVQFAKIRDKIAFYSTLPDRASVPHPDREWAGSWCQPQCSLFPFLLSHGFHTLWAEAEAGNGAHGSSLRLCWLSWQGLQAGEGGCPYSLLVPAGSWAVFLYVVGKWGKADKESHGGKKGTKTK